MGERLLILDANSILHRAYHALPPLTTKKGELVNAIYGFLLVLFRVIKEFQPDYVCACFDFPAKTFRHEKFKEYKAQRPPCPKDLASQIPKLKEILEAFKIPIFEKEGFEADDLIGAISKLASKKKKLLETIILSADLDTLQLVDDQTKVYILKKGVKNVILYDREMIKEKYQGITPEQLPDFKALKGDPSDNIPGIVGVGEKTAISLLLEFGNLETLYKEIEEESEKAKKVKQELREVLLKSKEQAFFNRELAQIKNDLPIDFNFEKCQWRGYNKEKAMQILKELEFNSLIKRLPELENYQENTKKGREVCQKTLF
jgi:DNA polymerase-1